MPDVSRPRLKITGGGSKPPEGAPYSGIACTIEVAVAGAASKLGGHSDTWKIKHPDGRIKNRVYDLTCRLMTVHHLPATQAPEVVSGAMLAIRANTGDNDDIEPGREETFSDRFLEVGGAD